MQMSSDEIRNTLQLDRFARHQCSVPHLVPIWLCAALCTLHPGILHRQDVCGVCGACGACGWLRRGGGALAQPPLDAAHISARSRGLGAIRQDIDGAPRGVRQSRSDRALVSTFVLCRRSSLQLHHDRWIACLSLSFARHAQLTADTRSSQVSSRRRPRPPPASLTENLVALARYCTVGVSIYVNAVSDGGRHAGAALGGRINHSRLALPTFIRA